MQMADSTKSALQLLEDLRKERVELDGLIQAIERRMGIYDPERISEPADDEPRPRAARSMPIEIGFFHNMSQAAAAEKLLKMNTGRALTTADILEAFKSGGME